ncbi:S-adenosyl-L-methionine-dependent methyltransferase [Mycena venus]|uniref:S-adenosyl-L-methionine-dependent methyltransferase n=1 Tax=Mycena venus TaxID=2733690 RepID=A0A8H6XUT5_9AGAR|nr:S-adenosyl-L-methionine-dependent methyltransferase [Mycena venus]
MSSSSDDAVAVAEHLLALVKARSVSQANSTEFYDKGIEVQATCDRLLRAVMGPLEYTALMAESCQESQALHFVTSLDIADIIGDGSLSVAEISEKTGVDTQFLGVVMNCMSGRGYFEQASGRYSNNALSAVLREGHPSSMKSAVGFVCDEGYNAASRLIDVAKRRGMAGAEVGDKSRITGTNLAFGFDCSVFEWMAQPQQAWRGERLGRAMKQLHGMANSNVPIDYAWSALASPIVDCGGGIGALEMAILKEEKNLGLEFTIFDIPKTVENAKQAWSALPPQSSSRVSFAPGNFLAPTLTETGLPLGQPTYLIRHVLHDWTDAEVLCILRNVRAAMLASATRAPEQKLLVCEMLLRPDSSRFVRTTSMQLLALNNGVTRTLAAMRALIEQAGFVVREVHHMRAVDSIIEAVIAESA